MTQSFGSLLSIVQQVVYNILYLSAFDWERISGTFTEQAERQVPTKPKCSYSCLITIALNSSKAQRLHLSQIISFIERWFPYYSSNSGDWKVEVRRTLSQSGYFRKTLISRGSDGRSRVMFWGFNPSAKAAAEEEVARWIADEKESWPSNQDDATPGEHTAQQPSTRTGCKRPRCDRTDQDGSTGLTVEDYFRLPPKRRWTQTNWTPFSTTDEMTSVGTTIHPHGTTDHERSHMTGISSHMICNSPNIEFDGIVQMDIDTHTLIIG